MKQVLILTSDDWSALKAGQGIPLSIGGESLMLMTEPGLAKLWAKPRPQNGHQEPVSSPRNGFDHEPRRQYTLEQKKEILEAVDRARKSGQTQDRVCKDYGIHSSLVYQWRKKAKAQKAGKS